MTSSKKIRMPKRNHRLVAQEQLISNLRVRLRQQRQKWRRLRNASIDGMRSILMRISAAMKNTDSRFSKILYEAYPSSSNRWLKGSVSEKPHSYSLSGASMSNDTSSATNLKTKKLLDGMFTLFNGMWTSIWSALMQLQSI